MTPNTDNTDDSSRPQPTGRSARFYAGLESEADVEAIAQRVAQHCAVALQRDEANFIQVQIQEANKSEIAEEPDR